MDICINSFKHSSYPHLLNNYSINYLIFLGSYNQPLQIQAFDYLDWTSCKDTTIYY